MVMRLGKVRYIVLKQVCKYMCLDRENRNGYFSNKFVSTRGGWTGANWGTWVVLKQETYGINLGFCCTSTKCEVCLWSLIIHGSALMPDRKRWKTETFVAWRLKTVERFIVRWLKMSLLVLTAAGVKHLRDHDIVHRDIKPGNILRCVAEDGRSSLSLFVSLSFCLSVCLCILSISLFLSASLLSWGDQG